MSKPIPKQEAKVQFMIGIDTIIEVYTASQDMDELAKSELPQFGTYNAKGEMLRSPVGSYARDHHMLVLSPLYDVAEVYLYLKKLFEE